MLCVHFISLSRSGSQKLCVLRCLYWSSWSCHIQVAILVRVLFHYGLAIRLGLYFFATCLLVYIIVVVWANTTFLRLVMEIGLLVFISIFKGSWRCSRISTKAVDHAFLSVFFILYLFLQQLLIKVILLNKDHCMARQLELKANSGLIVQLEGIVC